MGFKNEVKYRVIDLLMEKWDRHDSRTRPRFYLIDSVLDEHFGVMLPERKVPYFARKAGMYGLTFEKSLAVPVGLKPKLKLAVLSVHVVTEKDIKKAKK